jgi:hypothetical protein
LQQTTAEIRSGSSISKQWQQSLLLLLMLLWRRRRRRQLKSSHTHAIETANNENTVPQNGMKFAECSSPIHS